MFVALLGCDDAAKLAAASGSVVEAAASLGVPVAHVASAPVNVETQVRSRSNPGFVAAPKS